MSWPGRATEHPGPLRDVRVLDMSAYAVGPWSASLLAMLGADVIKVDPPYGDPIRRVQPSHLGEPTTYTTSNQGKRDIVLDLKSPADRDLVLELASIADILIENFRSGTLDRLGLGYEDLRKRNPRLIYCSSGSYGDRGPMAAVGSTDPHGQAFNGFASVNGLDRDNPELLRYHALVDLSTSTYLAASALLGLRHRKRSGEGCHFESSQMEAALAIQTTRMAEFFASGRPPEPRGSGVDHVVPSRSFRCRDGRWLNVTAPSERAWASLCTVIGREDLAARADLATNADRVARRREVEAELEATFASRDARWWRLRLTRAGVPNGEHLALDDAIHYGDQHPLAPFLRRVPHPIEGTIASAAPPWTFSRTPARLDVAPLPDQHGDEIRARVTGAGAEAPGARAERLDPFDALAGLRVLELSQGVAGPYCGLLLAATGADVLKLEPPEGDAQRRLGPPFVGGTAAAFCALNRGKRSVRADWFSLEGRAQLNELLSRADVVITDRGQTGIPPATPFDATEVEGNPRAIVCGISPLGEEGTLAGNPGTELEAQGFSGITRYLGELGGVPVRIGAEVGSILAGAFAFQAILAALHERDRSGLGQYVATSALGSIVAMETVMIAALSDPDAWNGFHCLAATYPPECGVRTKDGAVSFSGPRRDESDWVNFCHEIGAPHLATDPEFDSEAKRTPKAKELGDALEAYLKKYGKWEVVEITTRHGGIAVPIQNYEEYFSHPQAAAMEVTDEWETRSGERFTALGLPWRCAGRRPHPGPSPPAEADAVAQEIEIREWLAEPLAGERIIGTTGG